MTTGLLSSGANLLVASDLQRGTCAPAMFGVFDVRTSESDKVCFFCSVERSATKLRALIKGVDRS